MDKKNHLLFRRCHFLPQEWHIFGATFHFVPPRVKLKEKLNVLSHVTQLSYTHSDSQISLSKNSLLVVKVAKYLAVQRSPKWNKNEFKHLNGSRGNEEKKKKD